MFTLNTKKLFFTSLLSVGINYLFLCGYSQYPNFYPNVIASLVVLPFVVLFLYGFIKYWIGIESDVENKISVYIASALVMSVFFLISCIFNPVTVIILMHAGFWVTTKYTILGAVYCFNLPFLASLFYMFNIHKQKHLLG